jgi:hypothetical protein
MENREAKRGGIKEEKQGEWPNWRQTGNRNLIARMVLTKFIAL